MENNAMVVIHSLDSLYSEVFGVEDILILCGLDGTLFAQTAAKGIDSYLQPYLEQSDLSKSAAYSFGVADYLDETTRATGPYENLMTLPKKQLRFITSRERALTNFTQRQLAKLNIYDREVHYAKNQAEYIRDKRWVDGSRRVLYVDSDESNVLRVAQLLPAIQCYLFVTEAHNAGHAENRL